VDVAIAPHGGATFHSVVAPFFAGFVLQIAKRPNFDALECAIDAFFFHLMEQPQAHIVVFYKKSGTTTATMLSIHDSKRNPYACNIPLCPKCVNNVLTYERHNRAAKQHGDLGNEDVHIQYKCEQCKGRFLMKKPDFMSFVGRTTHSGIKKIIQSTFPYPEGFDPKSLVVEAPPTQQRQPNPNSKNQKKKANAAKSKNTQ